MRNEKVFEWLSEKGFADRVIDHKKSGSHLCTEPKDMRFRFIYHHKDEFRMAKMAEVLKVTVGGYYSWLKRLYK